MDFMTEKETNDWIIPLYKIYTDDEDVDIVTKIIRRGSYWSIGPEIEELENTIKNYVGVDYCVALNSGTSALHAMMLACGIGQNDSVIVPSFSFIATANAVLFVGATPNFADIEEDTFGLDPNVISHKISPNTKAVMPMDFSGRSCKIFEIKEIAKKNNLLLIEDAAESLGSTINGKKVGSISDVAIFSFCGNKVLTTGEGGAIITNSKEVYEKIKLISSHGRIDSKNYFANNASSQYKGIGYNWRMSSMTAALGLSQLNKLDKIIKMRQKHAKDISSKLSKQKKIKIPQDPDGYSNIYQMYNILLDSKENRDGLQKYLKEKRIFSKVFFEPIHLTPFYSKKFDLKEGILPITEKISNTILTLPIYPNMTSEEKDYLANSVLEFFEKND